MSSVSISRIAADVEYMWLHAYVGSGPHDPTPIWKGREKRTYGQIHRGRPQPARFAITEDMDGDFMVFDMFEVQLNDDYSTFMIPADAVRIYTTLDAAIMSAKLNL